MKYSTVITAAALSLLLSACGGSGADNGAAVTDSVDETPLVDIDIAHRRSVPQTRTYTANVEADNINNIAPDMSNRIRQIKVDVGDRVSRGQVLVTLDTSNADRQRINLEELQREYDRAVELLKIGAGTQRAVDQVKAQLDAARAQYANTMDNTVLRSPINGIVTARNYDPGDMTGQLPVLTVGQTSPAVKLIINAGETDLPVIHRGMDVDIDLDAWPGRQFRGRITRIAPAIDVATRTFPVEVTVANRADSLRPGMFGRVTVNLGSRDNVVVPDRAVVKQSGSANRYVYVYSGGKVAFRRVELGNRLDDAYELISGINDGDTVVITGQARLADGVAARINKSK